MTELGCPHALEQMMYEVRIEMVGATPKTREEFNPEKFLNDHFKKDDIIVKDSDKDLKAGYEGKLKQTNIKTKFKWENMTEDMKAYEDHEMEEDEGFIEDCEDCNAGKVHECLVGDKEPNEKENKEMNKKKETSNSKKPKRVLMYSTKKLLAQLAKNLKTSLDGTFKSCCQLWGQSFVWMVKQRGYWVPVCWSWLPDKTEISYKIYLALVLEVMEDLGMKFDIHSVTSDFELAIMKAVDEVLQVDILGYFFHLKKVFTNKVDKKGFKIRYQHD